MFRTYEQQAAAAINEIISELGFRPRAFDMRSIPFSGSWGTSSSIAFALANEAVAEDAADEDESLSKKERKAIERGHRFSAMQNAFINFVGGRPSDETDSGSHP